MRIYILGREKKAANLKSNCSSHWKNTFIVRVSVSLYANLLLLSLKMMSWRKPFKNQIYYQLFYGQWRARTLQETNC